MLAMKDKLALRQNERLGSPLNITADLGIPMVDQAKTPAHNIAPQMALKDGMTGLGKAGEFKSVYS